MKAVIMLPREVIYFIENTKFEAGFIFYGSVIALLLPLMSGVQKYNFAAGFRAVTLPYTEIQPHGTPLESITPMATIQPVALIATDGNSTWPMHGRVTTEFGASDYPFQTHHTGIDITSARPAGVTPVGAFRAGTVAEVIHAYSGYGNHVVIDHGGGLTSLYGHLYSTNVSVGQQVKTGQTIGTEGSTGASTGPHVHFEIRQDGVAQSPRRYLPGNP